MLRITRLVALALLATALAERVVAQSTPGPPDWKDGGTSVYLSGSKPGPGDVTEIAAPLANAAAAPAQAFTTAKVDTAVVPTAHVESPPSGEPSRRRLAPPSDRQGNTRPASSDDRPTAGARRIMDFGIPTQSIYTVATGLTIVVGSFLVFVWALRRGARGGRRGTLPADAVSVLGRVPLASRQVAELLRVGNKLVLVALTPSGPKTITEITDSVEVDRLVGMCQTHNPHSTTQAFEQVFQNLSREPIGDGFLGADSLPMSLSPVAAAYRSQRGGTARA